MAKSESDLRNHIDALISVVQRLENENRELRRELAAIDGENNRVHGKRRKSNKAFTKEVRQPKDRPAQIKENSSCA